MLRPRLPAVLLVAALMSNISAGAEALGAQVLASGQAVVPTSSGPSDPNFNFSVTADHTMPLGLGSTVGLEIQVNLRDAGRPDQVCDLEDDFGLFDDCVAVDWPFTGPLPNLVELQTSTGITVLHLRRTNTLSLTPEPPDFL